MPSFLRVETQISFEFKLRLYNVHVDKDESQDV